MAIFMQGIAEYIANSLDGRASSEVIVFLISLLPILELRGGLIAAKILGLTFWKAFAICYIGNMLPIPFILLFIRKVFAWLKKYKKINNIIEKLEVRSVRKGEKIRKYRLWGLFLFVAIPLPGTGAWTGALAADLFDIRIKYSLPVIAAGVLVAGAVISTFSYGLFGALGF